MPHQQVLSYPPAKRPSVFCSLVFLRYALYGFNTVFLLTGLALLGFGIWTLLERLSVAPVLSPLFVASIYATCITGAVVLTASVIGCQGTAQEKRGSMIAFIVLLVLILLSEVATGVISYLVYTSVTQSTFTKQLSVDVIQKWNGEDSVSKAIDHVQVKYKCCGAEYYTEWREQNKLIQTLNTTTPDSCCITNVEDCGRLDHPSNLNRQGCAKFVEEEIQLSIILIPSLNLGFAVIQIFGIVFSCVFMQRVSRSKKFVRRQYNW